MALTSPRRIVRAGIHWAITQTTMPAAIAATAEEQEPVARQVEGADEMAIPPSSDRERRPGAASG